MEHGLFAALVVLTVVEQEIGRGKVGVGALRLYGTGTSDPIDRSTDARDGESRRNFGTGGLRCVTGVFSRAVVGVKGVVPPVVLKDVVLTTRDGVGSRLWRTLSLETGAANSVADLA